jgi:Family of unknown function (DUF6677)
MSKVRTQKSLAPPPIVAITAWLVPGAGYWLIGQKSRALTVGITIWLLFISGVLIGGVKVVEAPSLSSDVTALYGLSQKPWFIGQVLAGAPGIISASIASHVTVVSHARLAEISTLYTAVAGMLNLLTIIDSTYRANFPEASQ